MTKYGSLTKYGADIPLSVYGVISKINSLFISTVLGISIGVQPIIGFNYGSGNELRVKETLKKVLIINFMIGILFNILFVLGTTAIITPVAYTSAFIFDNIVAIAVMVLLWLFTVRGKRLSRFGGGVMLLLYAAYFANLVWGIVP